MVGPCRAVWPGLDELALEEDLDGARALALHHAIQGPDQISHTPRDRHPQGLHTSARLLDFSNGQRYHTDWWVRRLGGVWAAEWVRLTVIPDQRPATL